FSGAAAESRGTRPANFVPPLPTQAPGSIAARQRGSPAGAEPPARPHFCYDHDASMPPTPLLEATAISKSYFGLKALRNVSFELRAGEVHALIGENGAGKSTLIKIVTGAVTADSGLLMVSGQPV